MKIETMNFQGRELKYLDLTNYGEEKLMTNPDWRINKNKMVDIIPESDLLNLLSFEEWKYMSYEYQIRELVDELITGTSKHMTEFTPDDLPEGITPEDMVHYRQVYYANSYYFEDTDDDGKGLEFYDRAPKLAADKDEFAPIPNPFMKEIGEPYIIEFNRLGDILIQRFQSTFLEIIPRFNIAIYPYDNRYVRWTTNYGITVIEGRYDLTNGKIIDFNEVDSSWPYLLHGYDVDHSEFDAYWNLEPDLIFPNTGYYTRVKQPYSFDDLERFNAEESFSSKYMGVAMFEPPETYHLIGTAWRGERYKNSYSIPIMTRTKSVIYGKGIQDVWGTSYLILLEDGSIELDVNGNTAYRRVKELDGYNLEGVIEMFNPRIGTKGIKLYKLNKEEMQYFLRGLWENTWTENLWSLLRYTKDGLLAVNWFYGMENMEPIQLESVPGGINAIKMGQQLVKYQKQGNESGYSEGRSLNYEFTRYTIAPIEINWIHGNYLDLAPYSTIELYLPFYGFYKLDPALVIGKKIYIEYIYSLFTGFGSINLYVDQVSNPNEIFNDVSKKDMLLYDTLQINPSISIPVDATGTDSLTMQITTATAAILPTLVAGAAAVPISAGIAHAASGKDAAMSVKQGADSMQHSLDSQVGLVSEVGNFIGSPTPSNITRTGGLGSEVSTLAPMDIRLIRNSPQVITKHSKSVVGAPQHKVKNLTEYDGGDYVKIAAITDKTTTADHKYGEEIVGLLQRGVII